MEVKVNTMVLVNGTVRHESELEHNVDAYEGYKKSDILISGLDEDDKTFVVDNLKQFTDFTIADSDKAFFRLSILDDVLPMGLILGISRRLNDSVISIVSMERLEW
jgi:hypothetical protein